MTWAGFKPTLNLQHENHNSVCLEYVKTIGKCENDQLHREVMNAKKYIKSVTRLIYGPYKALDFKYNCQNCERNGLICSLNVIRHKERWSVLTRALQRSVVMTWPQDQMVRAGTTNQTHVFVSMCVWWK